MKLLFLLIPFLSFPFLTAQSIIWQNISAQHSLPQGVKLFAGSRVSPALKVWYLEVNMNQASIALKPYTTPVGKEGITAYHTRYNFIAAINGGYFDTQSNSVFSAVVQPGTLVARNINSVVRDSKTYLLTRTLFSFIETRKPAIDWIYHFGTRPQDVFSYTSPNPNAVGTPGPAPNQPAGKQMFELFAGIGGGPMLVKNRTQRITYTEEVFWGSGVGLDNRDPRTGVGFTADNKIILAVADGRQTASEGLSLPEFAQMFIDLGCVDAMNLDGGGSSQMAVKNTLINMPEGGTTQRLLPAILAVVTADSIGFLPPVYYDKRRDTGDEGSYLFGSGWIESTLAGFYGSTPTQIALAGSANTSARIVLQIPKAGRYRLDAWWTAASNRANNTPFIVTHSGGTDTVRLNQSINGSKWNRIGEFTFSADTLSAVTIATAAETGKYVAADAIRILSFDSSFTTSVLEEAVVPSGLKLEQNFPNPFNPSTRIDYYLPESGFAELSLFDVLGEKVTTVVSGEKKAGKNSVEITVSGLASGVYFYRLQSGGYSISKKLVVLR